MVLFLSFNLIMRPTLPIYSLPSSENLFDGVKMFWEGGGTMQNNPAKKKMKMGAVSTNKVGSESRFEICAQEDWDAMTEEEQDDALLVAMWDSGMCNVYLVEEE